MRGFSGTMRRLIAGCRCTMKSQFTPLLSACLLDFHKCLVCRTSRILTDYLRYDIRPLNTYRIFVMSARVLCH